MRSILPRFLLALALAAPATATSANVIVDWDTKAIAVIVKSTPGPLGLTVGGRSDRTFGEATPCIKDRILV